MSDRTAIPPHIDGRWTSRESWLTGAIIVVFWAALNWPWLSGTLTIPWDAQAHFQPQLQFLAGSIARGEAPFWNPFVFSGHPQIADPQSLIFSPPHLIAALLFPNPTPLVGDAVILGMLLLGALAIMALFRDRNWAPAGAVAAALVFAFGASAAWRIQHVGQVLSISWFAITLWLMSRALARRSGWWGLAAGFAAGFLILGRDQVAMLGCYTLAGLVIAAWLQSDGIAQAIRASLRPLACMALGALLVATVPILLTLTMAEQSNRPAIDLIGAGKGSLHPASLLTLVVSNLFGAAGPLENFWGQPSPAWNATMGDVDLFLARNMSVAYLGAMPLLAIVAVGVLRGAVWHPQIRSISIAAALMLVYALGRYTPVFGWIHAVIPGVSFFRRPADSLFNFGAMAAILAGYCIHVFVSGPRRRGEMTRWVLAAILLVAAGVGGYVLARDLGREAVALVPLAIAGIAGIIAMVAFLFLRQAHRNAPIAAALVVAAALGVDLAASNGPSESTGLPSAMYNVLRPDTRNETIAALKSALAGTAAPDRRDRIEIAGVDFHWPNASMTHRLDNTLGYNPLRLGDYSRATGAGDHVALPDQRRFSPLMPGYNSLMSNLLGLRFVVTRGAITAIDGFSPAEALPEVARTPDGVIYENPGALPRVLLVHAARPVNVENALTTGAWPAGFDPLRTVLLDGDPPSPLCPQPSAARTDAVQIVAYDNNRVVVDVTTATCGFLVLNDTWHRWWTVTVDGKQSKVLRANVIFRAVQVPAGQSRIEFSFHPFQGLWRDLAARLPATGMAWAFAAIRLIDRAVSR